jgi:hypothetical protein
MKIGDAVTIIATGSLQAIISDIDDSGIKLSSKYWGGNTWFDKSIFYYLSDKDLNVHRTGNFSEEKNRLCVKLDDLYTISEY